MKRTYGGNTRKPKETSKQLLKITVAMVVMLTIATVVAVFVLGDTSPLAYLIPSVFGLASTTVGFYLWKAKNENIAKYGNNVSE